MQENHNAPLIIKPRNYVWYLSLILLGGMVLVSALFAWLKYLNANATQSVKEDVAVVQSSIDELSNDRKILIANIIKNNTLKPSLDLGPLIVGFRNAAQLSNVRLKWFSVSGDTITTTLIATEGDSGVHPDPAATVIKMIKEYASGKMEFELEPIISLSWDPSMRTTGVEFRVLPRKLIK